MVRQGQIGWVTLLVTGCVLMPGSAGMAQTPFHLYFNGAYGPMRDGSGVHTLPPGGAASTTVPWYLLANGVPVGIADPGQTNGSWKQFHHHYDEDPPETVVGWYFAHHQAIPGVVMAGAGHWTEYTASYGIVTGARTEDGTYADTFVILPDPGDETYSRGQSIMVRIPFRWRIPIVNPPPHAEFPVSGCAATWSLVTDPSEYTETRGEANAYIAVYRTSNGVGLADYRINILDKIHRHPVRNERTWSVQINTVESGLCPEDVFSNEGAWVEACMEVQTEIGEPFKLEIGPDGIMAGASIYQLDSQYGSSGLGAGALAVQLEEPYAYELVGSGSIPPGAPLTTYARGCSNVQTYRLPGDANLDGSVDSLDLLILVDAFGSYLVPIFDSGAWPAAGDANPYDVRADFNLDGAVDTVDLLTLQANFGCDPVDLPPQLTDEEWEDLLE